MPAIRVTHTATSDAKTRSLVNKESKRMDIRLEVKALSDEGTFEGDLSVYNFVDYGGDVVEPGAFTKTLKESGGKVPLLLHHDLTKQVGVLELTDGDHSLQAKGTMNMDLPEAQQQRSMMRFNMAHGLTTGMSIGFITVKDTVEKGIRYLKEIKLLEGSIVTLPMNRLATVQSVKQLVLDGHKAGEFADELEEVQAMDLKYQIIGALCSALCDALDAEDAGSAVAVCDGIFDDAKLEWQGFVPRYLAAMSAMQAEYGMGWMGRAVPNVKALQMHPQTRERVGAVINNLKALMGEDPGTLRAAPSDPAAASSSDEPVLDHSQLEEMKSQLKECY